MLKLEGEYSLKIIDAHLHFSNGEGLEKTANEISHVDYSPRGLNREFKDSDVVAGIIMTIPGSSVYQPAVYSLEYDPNDEAPEYLLSCVGVNPLSLLENSGELLRIERELNNSWTVGIKIYAGYFPYYVYDPIYDPIYELARKYNVPVAIHCGDTQSSKGILKYSHPLTIDELAVKHGDINFIICHLGVPWVIDTAELILKNTNVYADVSGLIAGNIEQVKEMKNKRLYVDLIQQGLEYGNRYHKILFGSDWPLVPIGPYVEFIKHIIPEVHHEDVFYNNALSVFPKLKDLLASEKMDID